MNIEELNPVSFSDYANAPVVEQMQEEQDDSDEVDRRTVHITADEDIAAAKVKLEQERADAAAAQR